MKKIKTCNFEYIMKALKAHGFTNINTSISNSRIDVYCYGNSDSFDSFIQYGENWFINDGISCVPCTIQNFKDWLGY